MARKINALLLYGALLLTTTLAYLPALGGALLWDDAGHITPPALQSWTGLGRIWTELGATQQYYPLTHSVFWIEHHLWGDAVLGYHLGNVLLHATSAWLIARLLSRLEIAGAELAAFLFALHPLNVESVAWISELKNTLSATLYLGAAWCYLHFDDTRRRRDYFMSLGLFSLALLAKTVTATLPVSMLVIIWWRRGALRRREDVMPLAPFIGLGLSAALLTSYVERHFIGAAGLDFTLSPTERLSVAARAIAFYFGKILFPVKLAFFYPRWEMNGGQLLPALVVASVLAVCWWFRERSRAPLGVALCFCAALFPALGFVDVYPFRYSFVADHFAYLATIPILVAVAAVTAGYFRNIRLPLAGLVLAAPLSVLTWREAHHYRNSETLYRANITISPNAWLPHNNLALILIERGARDEARTHLLEALRLGPNTAEHHLNVGRMLADEGSLDEARRHFERALELDPSLAEAENNIGVLVLRQGDTVAATQHFITALRSDHQLDEARINLIAALQSLGVARAAAGQYAEAIEWFQRALAETPADADLRYDLGTAYLANGMQRAAIEQLEIALRLKPDFTEAAANLSMARAGVR